MKIQSIKYSVLMLVLFAVSLAFVSCDGENELFGSGGILADRNVISSIRQEIADKQNSDLSEDGDVFWTASGSLWHGSADCSYLANSKTVYHGTLDEAKLEGKERACDRCGTGDTGSIYEKIADNEIADGDVFFTESGTLIHTKEDCTVLSTGEKVYHANRALAATLGKREECEECKE